MPPGTQIVDRSEVFGEHQAPNTISSSAEVLDNIIEIVVKEAETSEYQKSENEPEDDSFEFRLFSNKPVTKVSLVEEEPVLVVTQRIVSLEQEETEEFQEKLQQSAISYDDVMQQSQIPYPAMKMAHHIVHIPAETAKGKKKRKLTKRQRDRLKALQSGKSMRDPRAPGGWPGWPGIRTQCAIITSLRGQLKSRPAKSNKPFSKSPKGPRDHKPKPAVSRVNLAISQSTTAKEVTSNAPNI